MLVPSTIAKIDHSNCQIGGTAIQDQCKKIRIRMIRKYQTIAIRNLPMLHHCADNCQHKKPNR